MAFSGLSVFINLFLVYFAGADGVFGINKTSGCIRLLIYPVNLKREIFNIKVKVGLHSHIHEDSLLGRTSGVD